ncbi:MAG TPA: hypothetical protein VGB67_01555 [Fibrella sp.]|jgi:hypothetical protein
METQPTTNAQAFADYCHANQLAPKDAYALLSPDNNTSPFRGTATYDPLYIDFTKPLVGLNLIWLFADATKVTIEFSENNTPHYIVSETTIAEHFRYSHFYDGSEQSTFERLTLDREVTGWYVAKDVKPKGRKYFFEDGTYLIIEDFGFIGTMLEEYQVGFCEAGAMHQHLKGKSYWDMIDLLRDSYGAVDMNSEIRTKADKKAYYEFEYIFGDGSILMGSLSEDAENNDIVVSHKDRTDMDDSEPEDDNETADEYSEKTHSSATQAEVAFDAQGYVDGYGEDEQVIDTLSNLLHFCHLNDVDFEDALRISRGHFEEESDPSYTE